MIHVVIHVMILADDAVVFTTTGTTVLVVAPRQQSLVQIVAAKDDGFTRKNALQIGTITGPQTPKAFRLDDTTIQ